MPPAKRRRLASFGQPLLVVTGLAVGTALLGGVSALSDAGQPGLRPLAVVKAHGGDPAFVELPLAPANASVEAARDEVLNGLARGVFGIAFKRPSLDPPGPPSKGSLTGSLVPHVHVDPELPPLRIEIIGLSSLTPAAVGQARALLQ